MQPKAHIFHITNPFEPFDCDQFDDGMGYTIREWLDNYLGEGQEFPVATLCILNGNPILREDYDHKMVEGDVVSFVALPGDPVTIIIAVVVAIISIAVTLLLAPQIPGELGDSDPVYSIKGQSNRIRLGEPIEVPYGRVVSWPSYAARPYNQYIGNEQFQYSLFCLGQGEVDIIETFIEDTPLSSFDEVETQVIGPGGSVTLFPDNVITSVEVSNIELLGSNEVGYPTDGWFGPFVANSSGTLASILQFDVVLPQGLYRLKEGSRKSETVSYEIEYREIDDAGAPLGSFASGGTFNVTRKTGTPQRTTIEVDVTPGRYEARMRRTDEASTSASVADTVQWESLRAFLPSTKNYGDVTLLATKIRATNQINSSSRSRIRVDLTSKIPVWDGAAFGVPEITRNPIWAMVDIFMAEYGGRLTENFLRLADLKTLADDADTRGDTFDFIFDRRSTVWEGARSAMRVMRSVPMLFGSEVSAIRDEQKTVVQGVFNKENIVPGSFRWDIRLVDNAGFDHLIVEYTDSADGLANEVICRLPTDGSSYPENIKMLGITSRDQAYREGMFLRATTRYHRETISFRTGMEGFIPAWGDLIRLSYDIPRWGFGGYVVAYDAGTKKITLSDPVGLSTTVGADEQTNFIAFRKADGSQVGSLIVIDPDTIEEESPGVPDKRIVFSLEPLPSEITDEFDFTNPDQEPTYFVLGIGQNVGKLLKVSDLQPDDEGTVEVTCVSYTDRAYAFDGDDAPAEESFTNPPKIPSAPIVVGLTVTAVADRDDIVTVTWQPSFGAQTYILQQSDDGTAGSFTEVIQTRGTSYILPITAGDLHLRVAAVNESLGPFDTFFGEVGVPANPPIAPIFTVTSPTDWPTDTTTITWEPYPVSGAQSFTVRIYDSLDVVQGNEISLVETPGLTVSYTADDMEAALGAENMIRAVTMGVVAINAAGDSEEALRAFTNDPPAKVVNVAAVYNSDSGTGRLYDITWDTEEPGDWRYYRLYSSSLTGFVPAPGNLDFQGTDAFVQIEVPFTVDPDTLNYHVVVVSMDRYANDISVAANRNFSDELVIEGTVATLGDGSGNVLQDGSGNILTD